MWRTQTDVKDPMTKILLSRKHKLAIIQYIFMALIEISANPTFPSLSEWVQAFKALDGLHFNKIAEKYYLVLGI